MLCVIGKLQPDDVSGIAVGNLTQQFSALISDVFQWCFEGRD